MRTRRLNNEAFSAYVFILPFIVIFLVFKAFPIIYSFYMSFIRWNGMGQKVFIGLQNYTGLLQDQTYIDAVKNTLILWSTNIVLVIFIGFVFALILNTKNLPMRGFFRTCLYLPQALAVVPLCLVFAYMFEFNFGFFNLLLRKMGLPTVEWLLNPNNALASIIGTLVWRTAPWHMVILLAGLQAIPSDLYEAASIDGCNGFQKVTRITVPVLRPIFFYCFLMGTISSFQVFQEPYVITSGGPGTASTTISLYMYRSGFEFFKLGYASAITFISLFIIMIISVFIIVGFRSEL